MYRKVIVTGSLAFDHIMSMPGKFSDHILPDKLHILNVSFIMQTFRQEFGGTAGNIAYSLALLGIPSVIVGSVGGDFDPYKKHLSKVRYINLRALRIFAKEKTARGFVITDKDDNQIWGFYEGAMKLAAGINIGKYLGKETVLMIAPDNPKAMLEHAKEAASKKCFYVFDPAFNIPHFAKRDLANAIFHSGILIGNDYEIELIKRRLDLPKEKLFQKCNIVITTLGSKGSLIQTHDKNFRIPPAKPTNESDPTGAGDAYRGGFLAGLVRGLPLDVCGKIGAVASVYTVEKYGTQTHKFTIGEFQKRYKMNFKSDVQLMP